MNPLFRHADGIYRIFKDGLEFDFILLELLFRVFAP